MPFEVATVGDNCIDRYLASGLSTVGGNAVNVAVHLARHGLRTAYFGAVGEDAEGARVIAALDANGVETGHVRTVAGAATGHTDIAAGPGGERIIADEEFGACAGYRPATEERALLAGCRHVHIGWLDDGGELRAFLAGAGVAVSQDLSVNLPGGAPSAAGLAIAFASAGPTLVAARRHLARLLGEGATVAVVTCGALGSLAADGAGSAELAAKPAAVADTLGAGDTFIAAFIAARLADAGLAGCLEAGRDAAASTIQHFGGFPQEPRKIGRRHP
jgi:fructoselysine 6-kinase